MDAQKLITHAKELFNCMEWLKDEDDKPLRVVIKNNCQFYDELVNLTHFVNEETSLSIDSSYEFTMNSLSILADADATELEEDNIEELSSGIEGDTYTSELTAWLDQSNTHVEYLTEAINLGMRDGYGALQHAQLCAKVEAFDKVCEYLMSHQ